MTRLTALRTALGTAALMIAVASADGQGAMAGPALLIEPASGQVLFVDNPDQTWYPASLTKLMTVYVTFEAIKDGRIKWDDKLALSEKARGQPATRIGLRAGIALNIEQAVRGLILRSANDFAMALAEGIGGSEEAFATLMNDTAKRLGMTRSHFKNPHGLPDPEQITTARDMGILAAALIKDFPDRREVFTTLQVLIHRQTFHSQNDLLRTLAGADGMKTGFTCGAGYNVVASATRNGRQLVAVVLGALTRTTRSARATELIEAGFAHLDGKPLPASPSPSAAPLAMLKPVALAEMPMDPAEATSVHDMSRTTRTRKCGNPSSEPRPVVAKATGKQPVVKAGATKAGAAKAGPAGSR